MNIMACVTPADSMIPHSSPLETWPSNLTTIDWDVPSVFCWTWLSIAIWALSWRSFNCSMVVETVGGSVGVGDGWGATGMAYTGSVGAAPPNAPNDQRLATTSGLIIRTAPPPISNPA